MNLSPTARPLRAALKEAGKRLFRRACEDIGVSLAHVADHIDVSHGRVERWVSPNTDAHIPLYLLASRIAVSDRLFARIVADLEFLRAQQDGVPTSTEGAIAGVISRAGEAIAALGRAYVGGQLSSLDVPTVRQRVADLESECARLRRLLEHSAPLVRAVAVAS